MLSMNAKVDYYDWDEEELKMPTAKSQPHLYAIRKPKTQPATDTGARDVSKQETGCRQCKNNNHWNEIGIMAEQDKDALAKRISTTNGMKMKKGK
jgi:hypothetical protein